MPLILTAGDVAKLCEIELSVVRGWCASGVWRGKAVRLAHHKVGPRGLLRIRVADLCDFLTAIGSAIPAELTEMAAHAQRQREAVVSKDADVVADLAAVYGCDPTAGAVIMAARRDRDRLEEVERELADVRSKVSAFMALAGPGRKT